MHEAPAAQASGSPALEEMQRERRLIDAGLEPELAHDLTVRRRNRQMREHRQLVNILLPWMAIRAKQRLLNGNKEEEA